MSIGRPNFGGVVFTSALCVSKKRFFGLSYVVFRLSAASKPNFAIELEMHHLIGFKASEQPRFGARAPKASKAPSSQPLRPAPAAVQRAPGGATFARLLTLTRGEEIGCIGVSW